MSFNLDDYETVAQRVARFQKANKLGRIHAEVVKLDHEKGEVLAKASIWRDGDIEPSAIDFAFGVASTYNTMMRKFYVEDTLTSAVGRALSLILEVTHKPTREDMSRVDSTKQYQATASKPVQVAKEDDPWTVKEVAQAQHVSKTMDTVAIEMLEDSLNAVEVPTCDCNQPMKWGEGTSKSSGKPWGKFSCPIWSKTTGSGCDMVIWYQIAPNGKWQPQKGWAK